MYTIDVAIKALHSDQSRPTLEPLKGFLIPGVFGDEPQLRNLRKRLQDTFHLDLLSLPDVGTHGSVLTSMVATATILVDEIVCRCPSGPVYLIGYSFGASMALEVAAQLSDIAREVAFLGVLDGPFEPPRVTIRKNMDMSPMALLRSLEAALLRAVSSKHPVPRIIARTVLSRTTMNYQADAMRRAMLWHLRNKALMSWKPRKCMANGIYISSGNYGFNNRMRWIELCPNLNRADIPAAHKNLLKHKALSQILCLLKAAVKVETNSQSISTCR